MAELPITAPGYETPTEAEEREDVTGVLSNRCLLNKETFTEAVNVAMHTPILRFVRYFELLLMALCVGLLLWALIGRLGAQMLIWPGFALAMLLYFYWQQFINYPKKAVKNRMVRLALDEGAEELENILYFKDENIANRRGEAETLLHMPYRKVKRLTESDRLIVITTRSRHLVPLDRQGFANGDEADFWRLITQKAPKAKRNRSR